MNILKAEIVVPDWVNWIAVDSDGDAWGYSAEPFRSKSLQGVWNIYRADSVMLYSGKPPKNFKDELYTWK